MPVLTAVDVLGIQRYVFGSNRLRDVLAASWMVDHVTRREQIEGHFDGGTPSVLLAAGGNAIVEFDTLQRARGWAARYSRWLHETAPGLDVVVVHRPYERGRLAWALRVLQVDLARVKQEQVPSVAQLGLSVTASCSITGLPATEVDQGELVSPGVQRLRACADKARTRWDDWLPALDRLPGWTADFPDEIDHMGRTRGQSSLVGVVHVDGNGVGKRIQGWLNRCVEDEVDDETVRAQYGEWSRAIDAAGHAALKAVIERVAGCIEEERDHCVLRGTPAALGFRLHDWRDDPVHRRKRNTVLLPLRPVLLGGDDLTFLCDGRVALDLAVTALRELERHEIPHLGDHGAPAKLTACAGVALVKAHAPFHRSYELAEDLCRSAKRARVEANESPNTETGSWIDWHIGTTRPGETVRRIRDRVYAGGKTTMRPYPIHETTVRAQSWTWFDEELLGPSSDGGGFRGAEVWSRNRVKALAGVVRDGADAVRKQLEAWKATSNEEVNLPGKLSDDGYVEAYTPLLDAIELLDLHLRLEPDARRHETAAEGSDTPAEGVSP